MTFGFTLVLPYYRNPEMLRRQAEEWARYPKQVRVVVVDDGSPEPDEAAAVLVCDRRAEVYRIDVDVPWNRNGARNLGTHVVTPPDEYAAPARKGEISWVLHTDIDHVLYAETARSLLERGRARAFDPARWYRFSRFRVGRADETRRKDALPADAEAGAIKPHVDSFLVTTELYWRAGGYDEDFSGSLGGSSLFLKHLTREGGEPEVLAEALQVYTTHAVADASDRTLSRDRSRYEMIRREKKARGDPKPTSWLRFPWHRER